MPRYMINNQDIGGLASESASDIVTRDKNGLVVTAGSNTDAQSLIDALSDADKSKALSGLTDVTITTPASGDGLLYDGSKWVNADVIVPDELTDELRDAEVIEGKNLIPTPYLTSTRSHRGISFIENADGSVGFSGTPNDVLAFYVLNIIKLKAGTYVLSDGNATVYGGMWAGFYDDANCTVKYSGTSTGLIVDGYSASISTTQNGTINVSNSNKWGYSKEFTIGQDCYVQFCARAGNQNYYSTNQSGTIYPMLCTKEDWDKSHEYKPYYIPVKDAMLPRSEQRVLGAKNFLKNTAVASTSNSVTFTPQNDGTILVNGTPSTDTYYDVGEFYLPAGMYKITDGLFVNAFGLLITGVNGSSSWQMPSAAGERLINVTDPSYKIKARIFISGSYGAISNKTVKPMIRLASDHDDTYVPYAMTNKELTDANASILTALSYNDIYRVSLSHASPSGIIINNMQRHESFVCFWQTNSWGSAGAFYLVWRYDDTVVIKDIVGSSTKFSGSFKNGGVKIKVTDAAGGCQLIMIPWNKNKVYTFTKDDTE